MSVHDTVGILAEACFRPESVGTCANDQLATLLVTKMCKPKKYFIDVGAHIGSIISGVIQHDSSIRIIAIEAAPDKATRLRKKFPTVEIYQYALGDSEGEVPFFINNKRSGYSSLLQPTIQNESNTTQIKVLMTRLDSLVSASEIDVVKVDVEGAEFEVFRGSECLLKKNRPTVMFESGPYANNELGFAKGDLWQWLTERGYAVLIPNRVAHDDPGLSKDGFIEAHLYPMRTTNYFAIPNERRIEIRDCAREILKISSTEKKKWGEKGSGLPRAS